MDHPPQPAPTGPARSAAVALALALTLAVAGADTPPGETPADDALVKAAFEAHNRARAEHKLPELALDPKLNEVAAAHARDMAAHETMAHEGSDKSTPPERLERAKYFAQTSAENVAKGQRTAAEAMDSWTNSPPHRSNILGDFNRVGIGVARDREGVLYWCADFATPWPKVDAARAPAALVEALNRERKATNKPPLAADLRLAGVSAKQAAALAKAGAGGANSDLGAALGNDLKESGYRYRKVSILVAGGAADADTALAGWVKDPANRAVLLGDFRDAGAGVATDAKGRPFWCLLLATPQNAEAGRGR